MGTLHILSGAKLDETMQLLALFREKFFINWPENEFRPLSSR